MELSPENASAIEVKIFKQGSRIKSVRYDMDKTDIVLIQLLLANSRQSYAELAEKLNLSVNAIHKRIQLLTEAGVIRKFTAKPSIFAAKATTVFIYGTSQLSSFQGLPDKLKTQGSIYWLALGGGKYLYIGAYLKSINELDPLVSYVKKEAGIPEPTVGIMAAMPLLVRAGAKPVDENSLCKNSVDD
jgi:DNA-binding Lrp family transcriptional regulator